jgi:excisionase family DNA binding protein
MRKEDYEKWLESQFLDVEPADSEPKAAARPEARSSDPRGTAAVEPPRTAGSPALAREERTAAAVNAEPAAPTFRSTVVPESPPMVPRVERSAETAGRPPRTGPDMPPTRQTAPPAEPALTPTLDFAEQEIAPPPVRFLRPRQEEPAAAPPSEAPAAVSEEPAAVEVGHPVEAEPQAIEQPEAAAQTVEEPSHAATTEGEDLEATVATEPDEREAEEEAASQSAGRDEPMTGGSAESASPQVPHAAAPAPTVAPPVITSPPLVAAPAPPPAAEAPKRRGRTLKHVRPAETMEPMDPARLWSLVPRHIQTLLAMDPADEEVAQNSYKRPFRESRLELIQRLLDPTLSLEDTARLLNVCPTTVRRYTNKGLLRHQRTQGDQRRFKLSDVLAFLEAQSRQNGS